MVAKYSLSIRKKNKESKLTLQAKVVYNLICNKRLVELQQILPNDEAVVPEGQETLYDHEPDGSESQPDSALSTADRTQDVPPGGFLRSSRTSLQRH